MELVDKTLLCLECGSEFEFPVQQQQQFIERGYAGEPKRCPACRDRRKLAQPARPRPSARPFAPVSRDRHTGPRQLHPATCSACGCHTEVPFKPMEGRPVYCRPCHTALKGEADQNRG